MAYTSASNSTGDLAVLFRNNVHASATVRFALKCDSFSISYSKTPIQIPVPQQSPEIMDLGSFRPSISISGVVDTVQPTPTSLTIGGQTYYIPFKNWLENQVYDLLFSDSTPLELEVGDTTYPQAASGTKGYTGTPILLNTNSTALASWTGGAVYRVSLQQARFSIDPAKEDRYEFSMQFVCHAREDWDARGDLD